ncbi:Tlg2-vesicle protein [Salix suchowensis]|nr:Tlg2-vesicle protein [Salix suchowensis]
MGIFTFSLAAVLSLPKQFVTVYLGVILEQSESGDTLWVRFRTPIELETDLVRSATPANVTYSSQFDARPRDEESGDHYPRSQTHWNRREGGRDVLASSERTWRRGWLGYGRKQCTRTVYAKLPPEMPDESLSNVPYLARPPPPTDPHMTHQRRESGMSHVITFDPDAIRTKRLYSRRARVRETLRASVPRSECRDSRRQSILQQPLKRWVALIIAWDEALLSPFTLAVSNSTLYISLPLGTIYILASRPLLAPSLHHGTHGQETTEAPINCKILLIGNSSVGKSSLLLRFSDEQWLPEDESSATIGVDFRDTAGQERFRTITSSYYRGAQGVILVYDVSSRESFDALPRWYSELETYVSDSVVKILVGNKVDKEFSRQVSASEAKAFADRMNSLFIEASAKTAVGVKETFTEVVEKILDTPELWSPETNKPSREANGNSMPGIDTGKIP